MSGLPRAEGASAVWAAGATGSVAASMPDAPAGAPLIELRDVVAGYPGAAAAVLHGVSLALEPGAAVAMIGPNGGGKTTLLRVACRALRPRAGQVLLAGGDAAAMAQVEVARLVGYVPQFAGAGQEFTVEEAVLMGRYPHLGGLGRPSLDDLGIAEQAMQATGVLALRDRLLAELSGGEVQRVLVARCLAQQPRAMLLDEPTSHLDLAYQAEVLALVRRLNGEGLTVLAVLHDLNLAAQFFGRFVLLSGGRVLAQGTQDEVLTPELLGQAYGATVRVLRDASGRIVRIYAEAGQA